MIPVWIKNKSIKWHPRQWWRESNSNNLTVRCEHRKDTTDTREGSGKRSHCTAGDGAPPAVPVSLEELHIFRQRIIVILLLDATLCAKLSYLRRLLTSLELFINSRPLAVCVHCAWNGVMMLWWQRWLLWIITVEWVPENMLLWRIKLKWKMNGGREISHPLFQVYNYRCHLSVTA